MRDNTLYSPNTLDSSINSVPDSTAHLLLSLLLWPNTHLPLVTKKERISSFCWEGNEIATIVLWLRRNLPALPAARTSSAALLGDWISLSAVENQRGSRGVDEARWVVTGVSILPYTPDQGFN